MNSEDQNHQSESDFDALAIVGMAVVEEIETVYALEAAFNLPAHDRTSTTTTATATTPLTMPTRSAGQLSHRERAQRGLERNEAADGWPGIGEPVPSLADGRRPQAQGDVLVIPLASAGWWPTRHSIATGRGTARVVDSATGRPQHVLTRPTPGVIWAPYTDPDHTRDGAVGLLEIPDGGHVQLTHASGEHDPLVIGPGVWLIRRQRAYAGAWTYNHLED